MLFKKAALCLLNVGLALAAPTPASKATTTAVSSTGSVRTSAPAGALVVGTSGKYSKVQDAVNALSSSSTAAQSIFIQAGTYDEQVYIPALKGALTVYGYTTDTSSYSKNTVTITAGVGLDTAANDDATGTLRVHTTNFKLYNVNVKNTRGQGSQALALSAYASVCDLSSRPTTCLLLHANKVAEPRLLRLPIHWLPGHYPCSDWHSTLRKVLHRRCYRLHLWPAWSGLVHQVGHSCAHYQRWLRYCFRSCLVD